MLQEISSEKRAVLQRRGSQRPPLSVPSVTAATPTARDVAKMTLFPQCETTPLFGGGASTVAAAVGIYLQKAHSNPLTNASSNDSSGVRDKHHCSPFRRSHSKPENPTSNMGARAIEEESRANAKKNGKKLIFLRNFSVSEEDVVVCNRVRCGVDPAWFKHRNAHDRRYLRSLSVEEARLAATRRRASLSSMDPEQVRRKKSLVVREDEPFTMVVVDPALDARSTKANSSPRRLASPRNRVEGIQKQQTCKNHVNAAECHEEKQEAEGRCDGGACIDSSKLTPREKAMHGRYLIRESFANGSYGKVGRVCRQLRWKRLSRHTYCDVSRQYVIPTRSVQAKRLRRIKKWP